MFHALAKFFVCAVVLFFTDPSFLSTTTGKESLEPLSNFSWSIFSGIYFGVHQMFILQPLAIVSPKCMHSPHCTGQNMLLARDRWV